MTDLPLRALPDPKPRRQDFATDDQFGEAYGHWMGRQAKLAAQRPAVKAAPAAVAPPASRAAPVASKPASSTLSRMSLRGDMERDTWNQHTKARFQRAKAANTPTKD